MFNYNNKDWKEKGETTWWINWTISWKFTVNWSKLKKIMVVYCIPTKIFLYIRNYFQIKRVGFFFLIWGERTKNIDTRCSRLNCVPPKDMFKSQPPVHINMTSFRNRVFVKLIKDFEMKSHWTRLGPKSNSWHLYNKRIEYSDPQRKSPHETSQKLDWYR